MNIDPLNYFFHSYEQTSHKNNSDSFSFSDFVDTINPLQHIPVISSIYRSISGDDISNDAKIAGSALYCGLFGVAGIFNLFANFITGKSVAEHAEQITMLALNENDNNLPKIKTEPVKIENLPPINSLLLANEVDSENSIWLKS